MSGSIVLLNLAGAVALLLFATRMVRTGVERAYGDILRQKLRSILKNPVLAVGAGAALAICLQSATAVALLVGSFVGSGTTSWIWPSSASVGLAGVRRIAPPVVFRRILEL